MKYSYEYKKQCVELYRQGKWAETPNDISEKEFHKLIRRWFKVEEACGPEALKHKNQNKVWTAEEKYELVAKALAGASIETTAIKAGIGSGLLYQWVRKYKMEGYEGLAMKKKAIPAELTPSEREEMIRLREENEYLKAENAVIKKEIALREEKMKAQLKARKQRLSKNSVKKDTL